MYLVILVISTSSFEGGVYLVLLPSFKSNQVNFFVVVDPETYFSF